MTALFWKPDDLLKLQECGFILVFKESLLALSAPPPSLFFSNWALFFIIKGIFLTDVLKTVHNVTPMKLSVSLCHPNPYLLILPLRFRVKSGARFSWGTKSGTLCWNTHWWRGATPVSCRSGTPWTTMHWENSVTAFWQLTAWLLCSITTLNPSEDASCSEGMTVHCTCKS